MIIVKVGGSLFDMPDLFVALLAFCHGDEPYLLVPGGGEPADAVRKWQSGHNFSDEAAHWLALRTMSLSAALFESNLPANIVPHPTADAPTRLRVLDGYEFCRPDDALPHSWDVTSDSIAARAAVVAGADKLVLLKSVDVSPGTPWLVAAANGWVDAHFRTVVADLRCPVEVVNFRSWWANIPDEESPAAGVRRTPRVHSLP